MSDPLHDLIEHALKAVEEKDLTTAVRCFAEDGVLIDPHYPNQHMHGRAAIAEGLGWAFGAMDEFGFTVINYFGAEDGQKAAVELDTHHVLKGGRKLDFRQVFVFATRDGLITRLQAYEPYGPGGIGGLILGMTRLWRRISL